LYLSENLVHMDKASQLQSILTAKEIIDEAIQLVRNISHSLMPPTLKDFGLESAVNDFFQKINGAGAINVNCNFHNYQTRLKPEKELIIFRVIQELINNIFKHSNANFIDLTQDNSQEFVLFTLNHDGKGMTQEDFINLSRSSAGLGLKNIQSRLKVIQGEINFALDISESFYKITIEIPKDFDEK